MDPKQALSCLHKAASERIVRLVCTLVSTAEKPDLGAVFQGCQACLADLSLEARRKVHLGLQGVNKVIRPKSSLWSTT